MYSHELVMQDQAIPVHLETTSCWDFACRVRCQEKFIAMAWKLGVTESFELFPVTNGVKQGCVLASGLFSMMFFAMLRDTLCDCHTKICHQISDWWQALQFEETTADDKGTGSDCLWSWVCWWLFPECQIWVWHAAEYELLFFSLWQLWSLNIKKTEVMYQSAPGKSDVQRAITVNSQILQAVDRFTYLGNTLSHLHGWWNQCQNCKSERGLWQVMCRCVGA